MPVYNPNKIRLCNCGCGRPCRLRFYNGRFKGYSKRALDCPSPRGQKPNGVDQPDRVPLGSTRMSQCGRKFYRMIKIAKGTNGWMREHRYVMMIKLGRPLSSKEQVHHKDKNTLNNALENLEIMSASDHMRHHMVDRPWSRTHHSCVDCGTTVRKHKGFGLCNMCYQRFKTSQFKRRINTPYKPSSTN
jgi:hypothetical protein